MVKRLACGQAVSVCADYINQKVPHPSYDRFARATQTPPGPF
nr:hypothetical protein [uncultured Campylobacter sp.]